MKSFTFISSPSHAWLEVKTSDAKGIQFSEYSPRRKGNIYLEEDCDAPKFLKVLRDRGEQFQIVEKYIEDFDPFC